VALADLLVLRALGLGDLLTAVPALRALRLDRPGHRLVLAAPAALAPLAALTGAVDAVLPQPGLDRPLRTDRPALAVNLHGRGPRSTALLRATRPVELWAYDVGPQWTDGGHVRRAILSVPENSNTSSTVCAAATRAATACMTATLTGPSISRARSGRPAGLPMIRTSSF